MRWTRIAGQAAVLAGLFGASTALAQPAENPTTGDEAALERTGLLEGAFSSAVAQAQQDTDAQRPPAADTDEPQRERAAAETTRVEADGEREVIVVEREVIVREEEEEQPLGVGVLVGGGVIGFATDEMIDLTTVGGSWEARVAIGTQLPIGLELGYLGSAQGLDAIGLDDDAILLSNGAEAVARFNIVAEAPLQPYAFGGAGLRNYQIVNTDENVSNLADSDNVFEVPVGAGVSFRVVEGLLLDVRGTYRFAFDDDLTAPDLAEDEPDVGSNLNSWGASLRVGFEF
jgi:opacity protein-like surface antigen